MSGQAKEIEALPPTLQDFKAPDLPDNKPVLFFHPYNFHAQKVSNRINHVISEKSFAQPDPYANVAKLQN